MEVDRRSVLNGIVLASLATNTPVIGAARVAAANEAWTARPTDMALVGDAAAQDAFLAGIRATAQGDGVTVLQAKRCTEFVETLNRVLRSGNPVRIVGLVDDGCGAFIVELARDAGARLAWLGQHVSRAGRTQHRIISAGDAGIGAARGDLPAGDRATSTGVRIVDGELWPFVLGAELASPGCSDAARRASLRSWQPQPHGSFVSFAIES